MFNENKIKRLERENRALKIRIEEVAGKTEGAFNTLLDYFGLEVSQRDFCYGGRTRNEDGVIIPKLVTEFTITKKVKNKKNK